MIQTMDRRSSRLAQERGLDDHKHSDDRKQVVQIMIVDAHLLIREGLQLVIGSFPQAHVYASLERIQDGLVALKRGDVLILGSSMPASQCLESVKAAQQIQASLGIVAIRQHLSPEIALPIIRSGIQGLLGEDASAKDLEQAIAAVAAGSTFLSHRVREILNGYVSHVPLHFTERELTILPLLRQGLSNFWIAQRLGLKEKTVEKHLTHIYQKLHIQSRTEAILRLLELHI